LVGVTPEEVLAVAPELAEIAELSNDPDLACDWTEALGLEYEAMIVANQTPAFSATLVDEAGRSTPATATSSLDLKWMILAEDDDSFHVMKFSPGSARLLKRRLLRLLPDRAELLRFEEALDLMDELPEVIFLCDSSWTVRHANAAATRLLGLPAAELSQRVLWDLTAPSARSGLRRWLTRVADQKTAEFDTFFVDAEGASLPVVLRLRSSEGDEHDRRWWVVVHERGGSTNRTVTTLQRKLDELTTELAETTLQIDTSSRLQTEFISNISHEFRTPLNAVLGYVELLRDGLYGPVTDEQREALDHVVRCATHLLDLINEVMDLSKLKNGQLELEKDHYSPYELVESVADAMQPSVRQKNLRLEVHCEEGLPSVYVDFHRIYQVLRNLLDNAVKFTHSGKVEIGARRVGDAIEFFVRDTGIGIPADSLPTIFDEFRQADGSTTRHYGGMGIGLSLSRRLVELHGGEMAVESRESYGSTFRFTIPLEEQVSKQS
jgi:signal transduction histidine kinase